MVLASRFQAWFEPVVLWVSRAFSGRTRTPTTTESVMVEGWGGGCRGAGGMQMGRGRLQGVGRWGAGDEVSV